jgi:hypothetical protein
MRLGAVQHDSGENDGSDGPASVLSTTASVLIKGFPPGSPLPHRGAADPTDPLPPALENGQKSGRLCQQSWRARLDLVAVALPATEFGQDRRRRRLTGKPLPDCGDNDNLKLDVPTRQQNVRGLQERASVWFSTTISGRAGSERRGAMVSAGANGPACGCCQAAAAPLRRPGGGKPISGWTR